MLGVTLAFLRDETGAVNGCSEERGNARVDQQPVQINFRQTKQAAGSGEVQLDLAC